MKSKLDIRLERQNLIRHVITHSVIETQSDLVRALEAMNCEVTQSTISRDIREMGLTKTLKPDGVYCYTLPRQRKTVSHHFSRMLSDSVLDVELAMNLVVVKTLSGSANMVAEAVDSSAWQEVVGTLAGDNTIFIATRSLEDAEMLREKIRQMIVPQDSVRENGDGMHDPVAAHTEHSAD